MSHSRELKPHEAMLKFAMQHIGLQEIPGAEDNSLIVQMFADIGHSWVKDDETAWCSCFINWVAHKTGCERSGKLNARSWLNTGTATEHPEIGDVVVFWRKALNDWRGHVGLFLGYDERKNIHVLSGNQNNEVNVSVYSSAQLLEFRKLNFKAI